MELLIGSAMTVAFFAAAFAWGRKAYRDGYMDALRDSKVAFDMMMAKGQIMPGPATFEEVQDSGDFGDIPSEKRNKNIN